MAITSLQNFFGELSSCQAFIFVSVAESFLPTAAVTDCSCDLPISATATGRFCKSRFQRGARRYLRSDQSCNSDSLVLARDVRNKCQTTVRGLAALRRGTDPQICPVNFSCF